MKTKPKCATIAASAFWSVAITFSLLQTVSAQGFINLNFEQASIAPAPPGYTPWDAANRISAASALPFWSVSEDSTICTAVWGSPIALDETSVALVSGTYPPIAGNYSVQLSAYANAPSGYYRSSSISQAGVIPAGTRSIQFLIASPYQNIQPNPIVTLNGAANALREISQSGGVITMAGDVSAFAGNTATLAFLCAATSGGTFPANENYFNLDDIQFSPSSIPEPSGLALVALGALLLGFRRRRNSRRSPNGTVVFSGTSSWYLMMTVESYKGQRDNPSTGQSNFLAWYSQLAFGGSNYENTPIGAASHVEEPQRTGVNSPGTYFGYWEAGKILAACAWNSANTTNFQAVGDPFVRK